MTSTFPLKDTFSSLDNIWTDQNNEDLFGYVGIYPVEKIAKDMERSVEEITFRLCHQTWEMLNGYSVDEIMEFYEGYVPEIFVEELKKNEKYKTGDPIYISDIKTNIH
jgi:hypothetical protein